MMTPLPSSEARIGADADDGVVLLRLARRAIADFLTGIPANSAGGDNDPPWLHEQGASFVTLTLGGKLRGCIGTLEAFRPLAADIRGNAIGAAVRDPRFPPLTADDLEETLIEVSVLSPVEAIAFDTEEEALAALRPGVDGVVFECGRHRATYLPQVWSQLPDPRAFLGQLKAKAGLPVNFWGNGIRLGRYSVTSFHEKRGHS